MQWWLGLLGLLGCVGWVFAIWQGVKGHEIALESRQFSSQKEYDDVMDAWDKWGLIIFIASVVLSVIIAIAYFVMFAAIFGQAASSGDFG